MPLPRRLAKRFVKYDEWDSAWLIQTLSRLTLSRICPHKSSIGMNSNWPAIRPLSLSRSALCAGWLEWVTRTMAVIDVVIWKPSATNMWASGRLCASWLSSSSAGPHCLHGSAWRPACESSAKHSAVAAAGLTIPIKLNLNQKGGVVIEITRKQVRTIRTTIRQSLGITSASRAPAVTFRSTPDGLLVLAVNDNIAIEYLRRLRILLRANTAVNREVMDKIFQWEIKQLLRASRN